MNKFFVIIVLLCITLSNATAQWTNRFNGEGDFSDVFHAIARSTDGSIYASGYTINPDVSKDILLVKFNASGDTVWTRQFAGAGEGPDEALDMALDASGNIILTGYQKGSGTGFDFITLKYAPNGNLLWTAIYNYSTNETDQSNVVTIDAAGNIYIAGQSDKDNSPVNDDDIVVIKYNSAGTQQWVKRTDGVANSTDRPAAIAIGNDGHVIITGRSGNGSDDDYITVKYNSTTGNEMWRKTFDRTHHDRSTGIAVAPGSGNILITGRSNNGNDYDFVTISYNADGVEQWQQVYDFVDDDRATHIATDNAGNVYVAGQSDVSASAIVNYNITVVKYNASGMQQYAQSYEGPGANDDIPTDLICDNAGNVTVAGYADTDAGVEVVNDMVAIRYNNAGVQQWATRLGTSSRDDVAEAVCLKEDGSVFIAGHGATIPQRDAYVYSLSNTGVESWDAVFNGEGDNSDNMHCIIRDASNNSIIGGYSMAYASDRDFLIMKLQATGDLLWSKTFSGNSTKQSVDDVNAIALDASNNIYAAGFLKNSGTGYDLFVLKLNASGDSIWSYSYNDPLSNETDKAIAIQVDGAGNVTILGRSDADASATSNDDILLIRLNASGVQQWISRYNGAGNGDDFPRNMLITPAGDIYVVGESYNGSDKDGVIIKYSSSGAQQWAKKYDGLNGDDEFVGIQSGSDGLFYVGGHTTSINGDLDALLVVYQPDGSLLHSGSFDAGSGGHDETKNLIITNDLIPVLATTSHADTSALTLDGDITAVAFQADATPYWHATFDGTGNDDVGDISYNSIQGIVIAGQSQNTDVAVLDYDYITLYVDESGISAQETYSGEGSDVANTLMIYDNGTYVSGGSYSESGHRDIVTILYGMTPDGILETAAPIALQVYPNPSAHVCTIAIPASFVQDAVAINLFNMEGRLISTDVVAGNSYTMHVEALEAGMYILQLETPTQTIQTTLIKSSTK